MPFGAQLTEKNEVRFRLWAPSAQRVMLLIDNDAPVPMQALQAGWYECISARAHPGSRYRYQIDEGQWVPDPASRFNPDDVHGASQVIDAASFDWQDSAWRGRPWEEAVIYEVHVGTFTPQGTFAALEQRLDYLADLGITAIELMPVADFPGRCNWGYDGALLFAPDSTYGTPDDLKRLVQSAHRRGLMMLLDVVYNHFGPDGNYLHLCAPQFFTDHHHTPWGAAVNFDDRANRPVREFYIHNALYWLEEYHFDGLRLDAVHAMLDDSRPHILEEIAQTVRATLGQDRHIHLILENDHNAARYLERRRDGAMVYYDAQWNDDAHHALHVLLTGEQDGYYADYADHPLAHLGRCLTEGFSYQGEPSGYRRGERRGESSAHLPPTAFVSFLQNHDQVGNRAFGERLAVLVVPQALHAATALVLLAPSPPLLFMGEEWGAREPFLFFCDFGADLARGVTEGRRRDFARFERFRDPVAHAAIPDPCAAQTFERSRLDWSAQERVPHRQWLARYRHLLALRQRLIVPRLRGARADGYRVLASRALCAAWRLGDGARLSVYANLSGESILVSEAPACSPVYCCAEEAATQLCSGVLPAWSVIWFLEGHDDAS
ncbi:MAG: malto-oligosyltrehalose trehalohydrolase [Pseudomonadota bacterium]